MFTVRIYVTDKVNTNGARTHPECLFGPVAAAADDGAWTSHGADVFQSSTAAHRYRGYSEVLHR